MKMAPANYFAHPPRTTVPQSLQRSPAEPLAPQAWHRAASPPGTRDPAAAAVGVARGSRMPHFSQTRPVDWTFLQYLQVTGPSAAAATA